MSNIGNSNMGPMDPQRFEQLVSEKRLAEQDLGAELLAVEPYTVPTKTSDLAREILDGSRQRRLSGGELLVLFEEASLHDLGSAAHDLRLKRAEEDTVTFIIDRNITYTNLCYANCKFCAFNRHQDDHDAFVLGQDQIMQKCRSVMEAGGSQILLQGGHHPKARLADYVELLRKIKAEFRQMWIHGLSPSEIQHFGRVGKQPTTEVLATLHEAGLDSIPGGGAEILSDRVRRILAPGKTTAGEWIEIMEQAHRLGIPTTATMMFAHIETFAERVEHMLRVRESQDRTNGYTAFIPWTFQPDNTPLMDIPELKKLVLSHGYLGSVDYLRTLAISRIALDNFRNIQASWVTQGKAIGQMTLYYGANDLGSTMMEESVVSAAGVSHSLLREDLEEMITGAGFRSALRDNGYKILD